MMDRDWRPFSGNILHQIVLRSVACVGCFKQITGNLFKCDSISTSEHVCQVLTLSKYKKDDLYLTVKQLTAVKLRIAAFHIVSEW